MGSASSSSTSSMISSSVDISTDMCIKLVMPMYYTTEQVGVNDIQLAKRCWNHIVDDTSPQYLLMKEDPNFHEPSCLAYFFTIFYERLFCVHPACKPLFRDNIQVQGKALARIISFILQSRENNDQYTQVLTDMAHRHVARGVKAHEYGIMGEVLIYSLAKVVGKDVFTAECAQSWVRIYSMIITVVVPFHVINEINSAQQSMRGKAVNGDNSIVSRSTTVSTGAGR